MKSKSNEPLSLINRRRFIVREGKLDRCENDYMFLILHATETIPHPRTTHNTQTHNIYTDLREEGSNSSTSIIINDVLLYSSKVLESNNRESYFMRPQQLHNDHYMPIRPKLKQCRLHYIIS